jgi:hypothetical protein
VLEALLRVADQARLEDHDVRQLTWLLYGLQVDGPMTDELERLRVELFRYAARRSLHDASV